jgi:hypothetical protein
VGILFLAPHILHHIWPGKLLQKGPPFICCIVHHHQKSCSYTGPKHMFQKKPSSDTPIYLPLYLLWYTLHTTTKKKKKKEAISGRFEQNCSQLQTVLLKPSKTVSKPSRICYFLIIIIFFCPLKISSGHHHPQSSLSAAPNPPPKPRNIETHPNYQPVSSNPKRPRASFGWKS